MGITRSVRNFEKEALRAVKMDYKSLRICELGNQYMGELDGASCKVPAKQIYSSWGAQHISIDLNGEDGALVIDLDKSIPEDMRNSFDLLTNYGTIEHVNNQFQAFKNVHDMTREGGVMIHTLPPPGNWPNHGRYYYPEEFVTQLAKFCDYQIIKLELCNCYSDLRYGSDMNMIMVSFRKTSNNDFMEKAQFDKLPYVDDFRNTGGYTKRRLRLLKNYTYTYLLKHPNIRKIARRLLPIPDL